MNKLEIPCAYQGGKQRLAKDIIDNIKNFSKIDNNTQFYDLCCGSGSISLKLINQGYNPNNIHMLDLSPWGLFYNLIGKNEFNLHTFKNFIDSIPKDITKIKQYASDIINKPVDSNMKIYHFLFLQACAFGSTATWIENNKWCKAGGLRDYWLPTKTSNRKSPVNPMMPMPNSLYARAENIVNTIGGKIHGYNYDINTYINSIKCFTNSIIYIDPPYNGTQKYGYDFNIYDIINKLDSQNNIFVSEGYKMNNTFKSILLSNGRTKGNINGKSNKKPNEEWLNIY